jgi:hypothetical protein
MRQSVGAGMGAEKHTVVSKDQPRISTHRNIRACTPQRLLGPRHRCLHSLVCSHRCGACVDEHEEPAVKMIVCVVSVSYVSLCNAIHTRGPPLARVDVARWRCIDVYMHDLEKNIGTRAGYPHMMNMFGPFCNTPNRDATFSRCGGCTTGDGWRWSV